MSLTEVVEGLRGLHALRALVAGGVWLILLLAIHNRRRLSNWQKAGVGLTLAAIALVGLLAAFRATATNVLAPREYDFLCFWTFGQALKVGSPYDVELLRRLAEPHGASPMFQLEAYCLYPPFCLVIFWPLGWLSYQPALAAWYVVFWGALLACILQLRRLLDREGTWLGWLMAAALPLGMHATYSAAYYAQTNFWMVAAWLAACLTSHPIGRGIWLGLAVVVKPLAAVVALDLVIRRQWTCLAAMLLPIAAGLVIFLVLQGPAGLQIYRTQNPLAGEIVAAKYTEPANQSLLAVLLRTTGSQPGKRPVLFPPFVLLGGALTLVTAVVLWRLPHELGALGLGYAIALGLLIYPGSLAHYGNFLLIPAALLWRERERLAWPTWLTAAAIAVPYGLMWGRAFFAANLIAWLLLTILLSARTIRQIPGDATRPITPLAL